MTPQRTAARAGRSVFVAVLGGAVVGAVVGGLGGRIAMRLTAMWTDGPLFTITGAEVGDVSLDGTLSLVGSAAQGGAIAGLLYAVLRPALPSTHRAGVFALLAVVFAGGAFLGDDEFDLFDPPLLTAALFLPLFPIGAVALSPLVERLDPQPPRAWTGRGRIVVAAVALAGIAIMARNLAALA